MKKRLFCLMVLVFCLTFPLSSNAQDVSLYAAGSLKAALGDVAAAFEKQEGVGVSTEFSPSGLLRQRIEKGEDADVFASANMKHPQTLMDQGRPGPVVLFARNNLCAMAQPEVEVSSAGLLDVILDQDVRLGTSTPEADPSGDYAWELFGLAEKLRPGSFEKLSEKALKLTGGPDSPAPPAGRNKYAWVMQEDKADVFLTYCTNAVLARQEAGQLQIVDIPQELSVGADYGLIVLDQANTEAWRLAMFILSPQGQKILADYGFVAQGIPAE